MLLMIDNYDSFTYNIVQYFGELGQEVQVYRNDAITLAGSIHEQVLCWAAKQQQREQQRRQMTWARHGLRLHRLMSRGQIRAHHHQGCRVERRSQPASTFIPLRGPQAISESLPKTK